MSALRRWIRRALGALAAALALLVVTFAIPLPLWRTGQQPMPPLEFLDDTEAALPRRLWIDTDAACGDGPRVDPDDCLALLLLARTPDVQVAGISSVFGNAPVNVTHRTARDLVEQLRAGGATWPDPRRGAPNATDDPRRTDAAAALRRALEAGPLTILALGPLTNLEGALAGRADLRANVASVVAVMGRRPGHLFHPAEGAGRGMLFGHGPVFRDFNFAMDPAAAAALLATQVPVVLVPYVAARGVEITGSDLEALASQGGAAAWVAARARGWLDYWRGDVGRAGFYPFDAIAAAYVRDPGRFTCAAVTAWVGDDPTMVVPFWNRHALLVAQQRRYIDDPEALTQAVYCPAPRDGFGGMLRRWLIESSTT
jgi:inosine-uridine nucleoside N-ribohydrolase